MSDEKAVMRGGEWDGFELILGTKPLGLAFQPKLMVPEVSNPAIDYYRTDEWEGERRVYRWRKPA